MDHSHFIWFKSDKVFIGRCFVGAVVYCENFQDGLLPPTHKYGHITSFSVNADDRLMLNVRFAGYTHDRVVDPSMLDLLAPA